MKRCSTKNFAVAMSSRPPYPPRGIQIQRIGELVTENLHEWSVRAINPHSYQGGRGGFPNQIELYALPVNPRPHFSQNHVFNQIPYFSPQQHFNQNQQFIPRPLSQKNQPIYQPQQYTSRSQPPHLGVVSGDSHYKFARDANMHLQQGGNGGFLNENGFNGPPVHHTSHVNQYQSFEQRLYFDPNRTHFQLNLPNHQPRPYRPPQRPSEFIHRDWEYAIQGPPTHSERFIVLSYNLLADYLSINHRDQLYNHIPSHMLDWQWRKRNIIVELGWWSADIMCFQEVDRFGELEYELKLCGYSGIWKMRTGEAVDGCAIFWRASRFKLLHEEGIEFSKLGLRNNVAQICVLESLRQDNNDTLPTSSTGSKKVVVCNIHVLYNPKRGEIKLGQVRNLLDKAHAVSTIWDNSPIIVCGDFNCTPKSPLYNFLSEQKLDLTDLARDKVSGQDSCTIRSPRRFIANQGSANISVSPNVISGHEYRAKQNDLFSDMQRKNGPDELNKSGTDVQYVTESNVPSSDQTGKCDNQQSAEVSYKKETEKISLTSVDHMKESPSNSHCEYGSPIDALTSENCKHNASIISDDTEIDSNTIDIERKEKVNATSDNDDGLSCKHTESNLPQESGSTNCDKGALERSDPVEKAIIEEDSIQGHTVDSEILPEMNFVPVDVTRTYYDRSSWTPMEIETATGKADSVLVEHPLKLQSTYTEVEGLSTTRDLNGEPQVTSYNSCFLGTVDYIWRSEGLHTVRTLAPIPKHAMQWTKGFPTKKWGSDHIALASELAFVQDTTSGNTEPQ